MKRFRLRALLRRLLKYLGYEVRRVSKSDLRNPVSNPFQMQKALLNRLGINTPVIFDIGAHHGETASQYRAAFPDATIYCFEPYPPAFAKLIDIHRGDTG